MMVIDVTTTTSSTVVIVSDGIDVMFTTASSFNVCFTGQLPTPS